MVPPVRVRWTGRPLTVRPFCGFRNGGSAAAFSNERTRRRKFVFVDKIRPGERHQENAMRASTALVLFILAAATSTAAAQSQSPTPPPAAQRDPACPPGVGADPPTVGSGDSATLSDKLAESKGIICPPAGHDPEMTVTPPDTGKMRVIRPPGTPGGDPSIQPK
jgi:hypothetical protein